MAELLGSREPARPPPIESRLCAHWKSVILRMNRTGLLTFVAEASAGSSRLALGPRSQIPVLDAFRFATATAPSSSGALFLI